MSCKPSLEHAETTHALGLLEAWKHAQYTSNLSPISYYILQYLIRQYDDLGGG